MKPLGRVGPARAPINKRKRSPPCKAAEEVQFGVPVPSAGMPNCSFFRPPGRRRKEKSAPVHHPNPGEGNARAREQQLCLRGGKPLQRPGPVCLGPAKAEAISSQGAFPLSQRWSRSRYKRLHYSPHALQPQPNGLCFPVRRSFHCQALLKAQPQHRGLPISSVAWGHRRQGSGEQPRNHKYF